MKVFIICPVRGGKITLSLEHLGRLEAEGHVVHWPPRDTDQKDDPTGLRICSDNLEAIKNSDRVYFVWDGESEGCLFDLGMAWP